MRKLLFVGLLVLSLLAFLPGCVSTTDSGDGNEGDSGSYEWALNIAEGVRDSELPGGFVFHFVAAYVDGDGTIRPEGTWHIHFYHQEDVLVVVVLSSGQTTTETDTDTGKTELPAYTNANVSDWLTAGDGEVDGNAEYDYRILSCDKYEGGSYDGVGYTTVISYFDTSTGWVAIVEIDADTGEVLRVTFA
jgi:hypothetical protein